MSGCCSGWRAGGRWRSGSSALLGQVRRVAECGRRPGLAPWPGAGPVYPLAATWTKSNGFRGADPRRRGVPGARSRAGDAAAISLAQSQPGRPRWSRGGWRRLPGVRAGFNLFWAPNGDRLDRPRAPVARPARRVRSKATDVEALYRRGEREMACGSFSATASATSLSARSSTKNTAARSTTSSLAG